MATADVTVYGAGAFGLAVAYCCAKRGARVRVIDLHGVAAGSSGGIVGAVAPHVPENWNAKKAFQFESLMSAENFWAGVDDISGETSGYLRSGRLQPIADDHALDLAFQRQGTARELWQGRATWDVVDAADHGDWAPRSPSGKLIYDTLTARIHPRNATRSLARAIVALGGEIVTEGNAEGKVVFATGWKGLIEMADHLGHGIGNGVKGQAALLRFDAIEAPQLFADALHIVPHSDGTVAIGSTSEREFAHAETTDSLLDDVITRAIAAFPVLRDAEVIERWAGVRPRAKSRAPMLGHHPYIEGAFVANGGFKIGFGMAPKVGAVMADLVLDGVDTIPDDFRVEASLPKAKGAPK